MPKTPPGVKAITLYIPESLLQQIDNAAKAKGMSRNDYLLVRIAKTPIITTGDIKTG